MSRAFLGLGANIGDPEAQIEEALEHLSAHPLIAIAESSDMLVNPAWGKTDQPDFHNMVVEVETSLPPEELLEVCQHIEAAMGRVREERWGPRLIDIDIVAYERLEMQSERLILPHPFAHEREFVMGPLRQIAPEMADWIAGRIRTAPANPSS